MTDRDPPRLPPKPVVRPPTFEEFRPSSERPDSPLRQMRPPAGKAARPTPGQRAPGGPMDPPRGRQRGGYPERPPEPVGRSWLLAMLVWTGIGLASVVGAAAIALMIWSPAGLVRDQLAARVKAKTGRDLVVAGPARLTFFPTLSITMADVSLSAPPGMGGAPTLSMKSLTAAVPLGPLLQREVHVQGVTLYAPVIDLRVDRTGRRSWDFATAEPASVVRYAQAGASRTQPGQMPKDLKDFVQAASPDSVEASTSRGPLAALEALSLQVVQIENGVIRYTDDRTGLAEQLDTIDGRLSLTSISGSLEAKGTLVWRAEPVAFEARLTSPKSLTEDRPARLALKLDGQSTGLDFDGSVVLGRMPEAEGMLALKAPVLPALMARLGTAMASGGSFEAGSVNGRLKANEAGVSLSDATIVLDRHIAQGAIVIERRPVRPLVRGNLQLAELDLNMLLRPSGIAPGPGTRPGTRPAQSIEDLLRNPAPASGPKVRGFLQRNGWSDAVIDLSALGLIDADLRLGVGRIAFRDLKIGATQMRVDLKDRQLTTAFDDIQLYDGRGSGLIKVDGAGNLPVIGANFTVEGSSALALLKDAANFDWVAGRARVSFAIGGQGVSERQIVSSLQGRADVQFRDGAVVGYNVTKILQGVTQGRIPSLDRNLAERTDFSEMAASFTIQNGIATNRDLRLISPVVRITGTGTASLPERTMDYTLRPKLAGSTEAAAGLEVPVKIAGSWDQPAITPDIDGVLKNPDAALDAIKQLGRQLQKGDGDAVDKAKELLNKFLRR